MALRDFDISELKHRFDDFIARYTKWSEPSRMYIEANFKRVNKDGYTWDEFKRGLEEIETSVTNEYDLCVEFYSLLDDLCPVYLQLDSDQRKQIRQLVADHPKLIDLVRGYANRIAESIKTPQDTQALLIGLAAISIEDCGLDYRDTLIAMAELYVRGEEAGIDPRPHFKTVAKLSSKNKPRGGATPCAKMLINFHEYAVLKERRERGKPYW